MIKYGHACVRLEADGRVLVIDPGTFTEDEVLDGADEVLVTHEHADHLDIDKLLAARETNPALKVHLPGAAADQVPALGDAAVVVEVGQRFTAAGFEVDVVGGKHAEIYEGLPGCANVGYVVDERLYHPGDSLFAPSAPIETLLVPAAAPWLKLAEALDFVRAVKPARVFPIHDAMFSDLGRENFGGWMRFKGGDFEYGLLRSGEHAEL